MIHHVNLNRSTVGPRDTVEGVLADGSLDFTTVSGGFGIFLQPSGTPARSLIQRYYRVPSFSFTGPHALEFDVPPVGTGSAHEVPPGTYRVVFRYGTWAAQGDRPLVVTTTPRTYVPPTLSRRVRGSALGAYLSIRSTPYVLGARAQALANWLRIAFNRNRILANRRRTLNQLGTGAGPGASSNSVEPLADGETVFPRIADVIGDAGEFCYVAIWGFDEDVRFAADGPDDAGTPTAEELLKEVAMDMRRAGREPNVKVLLWEATADPDYEGGGNDVGDLAVDEVEWADIRRRLDPDFLDYMRDRGNAASDGDLLYCMSRYRALSDPPEEVYFPTGVEVALQNHPTKEWFGAHHQKFVLTEQASYVGGLNFYKHYWDTRDHPTRHADRASSGSGSAASGDPGPHHDTGSIVRGPVIEDVWRVFATRWDQALRTEGGHHRLVNWFEERSRAARDPSDRAWYDDLARRFRNDRSLLFDPGGASLNTSADPAYEVDAAAITNTLPAGTAWARAGGPGVTETRREYEERISAQGTHGTYTYAENQYFTDHDIASEIGAAWEGAETEGPFAAFVVPYDPATHPADLGGIVSKNHIVEDETKNLKWLEIKTARSILVRNGDDWEHRWAVRDPRSQITFLDDDLNDDPSLMDDDSDFRIEDAVRTDPDGTWQYTTDAQGNLELVTEDEVLYEAEDVLTVSDAMAYTLVSRDADPSAEDSPDGRLREFLGRAGVYVHSKSSIFLNRRTDEHWATIGSSNLNPRGLGDGGEQDSEMNVWWTGADRVEAYFEDLWSEHLDESDPDRLVPRLWEGKGWENFVAAREGLPVDCAVVRLDLIDREADLLPWWWV